MDTQKTARRIIELQIVRQTTQLYKGYLEDIEDIFVEQSQIIERLKKNLPTEYHVMVDAANSMDKIKFERCRKRILDSGNDAIRNLIESINPLQVDLPR